MARGQERSGAHGCASRNECLKIYVPIWRRSKPMPAPASAGSSAMPSSAACPPNTRPSAAHIDAIVGAGVVSSYSVRASCVCAAGATLRQRQCEPKTMCAAQHGIIRGSRDKLLISAIAHRVAGPTRARAMRSARAKDIGALETLCHFAKPFAKLPCTAASARHPDRAPLLLYAGNSCFESFACAAAARATAARLATGAG